MNKEERPSALALGKNSGLYAFGLLGVVLILLTSEVLLPAGRILVGDFVGRVEEHRSLKKIRADSMQYTRLQTAEKSVAVAMARLSSIPMEGRSSHILDQLVKSAKEYGLVISELKTLDEIPRGPYLELPVDLLLKGKYPQLSQYLAELEGGDLPFQVRRLQIQNPSWSQTELKINMELSAYVLK